MTTSHPARRAVLRARPGRTAAFRASPRRIDARARPPRPPRHRLHDGCLRCSTGAPRRRHRRIAGVDVRVFRNLSNALAYHRQFFTPIGLRGRSCGPRRDTFDIAHLHACHNLPGAFAADALARAGVPYVVAPNGTARRSSGASPPSASSPRTVGRGVARERRRGARGDPTPNARSCRRLGIAGARIATIPNPIDESEFDEPRMAANSASAHGARRRTADRAVLGKLTPRKGVDVLVRAFAGSATANATLVIAGNDMGVGVERRAPRRRLGLGERVVRPGLLRGRDRLEALAAADVVVYPSRDEVFGLVPLEALLCGTPVVVCDDSGCGEVIATVGGGLHRAARRRRRADRRDRLRSWRTPRSGGRAPRTAADAVAPALRR